MSTDTLPASPVPGSEEVAGKKGDAEDKEVKPDRYLYHALQSSRSAISELDKLASGDPPQDDGHAELKRIEADIMGDQGRGGSVRSVSVVPRGRDMASSIGSPLVRLGGIGGRAESVAMSGLGAPSPLASVMSLTGR
jgi:hypothetical protein